MSVVPGVVARARTRWVATSVAVTALVVGSSATAWATTTGPTPVKANPRVSEVSPAAQGDWFGWSQNSAKHLDSYDFFVQQGDGPKVRVNASGTQGLSGDIVDGRVVYAQQDGDRTPRITVFDPATGTRTALPDLVNHRYHRDALPGGLGFDQRLLATVRGDVSASGRWVLYTGRETLVHPCCDEYPADTLMLYDRSANRLRRIDATSTNGARLDAGQVDGRWVAYRIVSLDIDDYTEVWRYDVRTGAKQVEYPADPVLGQSVPAIASDGTVYYFQQDQDCRGDCAQTLYRWPVGAEPEVIASVVSAHNRAFWGLRVQDLPDGSRAVYYSTGAVGSANANGDVFRIDDQADGSVAR